MKSGKHKVSDYWQGHPLVSLEFFLTYGVTSLYLEMSTQMHRISFFILTFFNCTVTWNVYFHFNVLTTIQWNKGLWPYKVKIVVLLYIDLFFKPSTLPSCLIKILRIKGQNENVANKPHKGPFIFYERGGTRKKLAWKGGPAEKIKERGGGSDEKIRLKMG